MNMLRFCSSKAKPLGLSDNINLSDRIAKCYEVGCLGKEEYVYSHLAGNSLSL